MPEGSRMGHVHLHIHDLSEAVDFYHGVLGFDISGVAEAWGAAFVSAGGYHHHLGLNTWAGEGAPQAPDDASGLRHFTIEVPAQSDLSIVTARLEEQGAVPTDSGAGVFVRDPSGNRVKLKTQE